MVGLIDNPTGLTIPCASCGRKMQFLSSNNSTHTFVCYHGSQGQPTYLNRHFNVKLDEDGKIAIREPKAKESK